MSIDKKVKTSLKTAAVIGLAALVLSSGAGCARLWGETKEDFTYKTLVGKAGYIQFVSGGKVMNEFSGAKVLYSNTDQRTLWIQDANGQEWYWQGDAGVKLDR